MTEYMLVGEVLKPQGVRGEAKVRVFASDPDCFMDWQTLYLKRENGWEPMNAACSRVRDGFAYMTLGGCQNPEDVEKLRGEGLYIDRAHAAKLPAGAVYICDLIGCEAVDENGNAIGTLTDVLQHGPVDVYVFKTQRGTMMAPALKAAFPVVDVAARRVQADSARLAEVAVFED